MYSYGIRNCIFIFTCSRFYSEMMDSNLKPLKTFVYIVHKNAVPTTQRTEAVCITRTKLLKLFREIIGIYL